MVIIMSTPVRYIPPMWESFLRSLSLFGGGEEIKTLEDYFNEFKKHLEEKGDPLFKRLVDIAPDTPSEEAYTHAIEELINKIVETEFEEDFSKMINAVENEQLSSDELEEKLLNILTPYFIEIKQKIDSDAKNLWENALKGEIKDEDIEKFEIVDKFFFLESNILGIILETKDIEVMGKLLPYFVFLPLRIAKIMAENKDISEIKEDFKIVARKIKEVHPTPTTIDDYFLEELLT